MQNVFLIPALMWAALAGFGTPLFGGLEAMAQQLAQMAVTALWQGAVVAVGLALCLRLAPRTGRRTASESGRRLLRCLPAFPWPRLFWGRVRAWLPAFLHRFRRPRRGRG